jgi:Alpha/beta hydrolase family
MSAQTAQATQYKLEHNAGQENNWSEMAHNQLQGYIFGLDNGVLKENANLVYFCHANGVSAKTYFPFLEQYALKSNSIIMTYDIRGFGASANAEDCLIGEDHSEISQSLLQDTVEMYWFLRSYVCKKNPEVKTKKCRFSGHSLGAWLCLFAAPVCFQTEVDLFDLPMGNIKEILQWNILCLTLRRELHPLSKATLQRKDEFESERHLNVWLQKGQFFRNWKPEFRARYKSSNVHISSNRYFSFLHSKYWEARLYQTQPAQPYAAFLQIEKQIRKNMTINYFWGSESKMSHSRQFSICSHLFGKVHFERIEEAGHFFVFERPKETIESWMNQSDNHVTVISNRNFGAIMTKDQEKTAKNLPTEENEKAA